MVVPRLHLAAGDGDRVWHYRRGSRLVTVDGCGDGSASVLTISMNATFATRATRRPDRRGIPRPLVCCNQALRATARAAARASARAARSQLLRTHDSRPLPSIAAEHAMPWPETGPRMRRQACLRMRRQACLRMRRQACLRMRRQACLRVRRRGITAMRSLAVRWGGRRTRHGARTGP
jgi:hypothetical protein